MTTKPYYPLLNSQFVQVNNISSYFDNELHDLIYEINNYDNLNQVLLTSLCQYPYFLNGEAIKYLRKATGLDQSQIAQELAVSRHTIMRWENSGINNKLSEIAFRIFIINKTKLENINLFKLLTIYKNNEQPQIILNYDEKSESYQALPIKVSKPNMKIAKRHSNQNLSPALS